MRPGCSPCSEVSFQNPRTGRLVEMVLILVVERTSATGIQQSRDKALGIALLVA